jgi:hypothetical protein
MPKMENELIKERISWTDVVQHANTITDFITKNKKNYNCIVSIGRGGMVLSRLLAENLNIKEIHIFNIYSYTETQSGDITKIKSFDLKILNNKNVLIVDDVCTTGQTILNMIQCIEDESYNVKYDIVTEYHNVNCLDVKPHYYAEVYNADEKWLVFPWELK